MKRSFIIHNDLDGIVSGLIFKHFNKDIDFKGMYDLETFYLKDKLKKSDIGVDLDINLIECYGHHVCPLKNEKSHNPNNIYLKDFYNEYTHKCPFNTAIILASKYNLKIDNIKQVSLLVFCDGMYQWYDKFKKNINDWLDRYNLQYIKNTLENNYEEIVEIIEKEILPLLKTKKYYNFKIKIENNELQKKEIVKDFCNYATKIFNLDIDFSIYDIYYKIKNNYIKKTYEYNTKEDFLKIQNRIEEIKNKVVSCAMIYQKKINITLIEDLLIY